MENEWRLLSDGMLNCTAAAAAAPKNSAKPAAVAECSLPPIHVTYSCLNFILAYMLLFYRQRGWAPVRQMAPRIPGIEPDQGVIGNHRKWLGIFDKHQTFHQLSNFNIKFVSELKDTKMDLMGYLWALKIYPSNQVCYVFMSDTHMQKPFLVLRSIQLQLGESQARVWMDLGKFTK